ncbi:pseudaminic acid cytidylyltransferase [Gaetbulibacter sp. M235]|uniref:pseudaminic acid cytidylyltransferase n=1 Tax=Gaetbulibacter sp. M235 TaxID=3126510 RepID=UPI00374EADB9
MANLAIIPARGGSKRIPKKNIKSFNGKPIIAYVIDAALRSNLFDEIMVSTDDEEIANTAKAFGATVPFFRSTDNANDYATLSDVLIEVIDHYTKAGKVFKNICCFLPTAALITPNKIIEAFHVLAKQKFKTVVPVIRFTYPIQRALKDVDGLLQMREVEHINTRSQDLEPCFHDSGQFYWLNTEAFLSEKKVFTSNTGYIELKEYEAQDVDTLDDWDMLELKYKLKK